MPCLVPMRELKMSASSSHMTASSQSAWSGCPSDVVRLAREVRLAHRLAHFWDVKKGPIYLTPPQQDDSRQEARLALVKLFCIYWYPAKKSSVIKKDCFEQS